MLPFETETLCSSKSFREAKLRAERKQTKRKLIQLHQEAVAKELKKKPESDFQFGFTARRLKRNGTWSFLPREFGYILKACEEFIDNPKRFPALYAWGGEAVNNIQCRRLIARVLACLLPNTDLLGGRVGMPTEAGIKTISYDSMQEDYVLRFGEYISPESFAKAIKYLKRAGYYRSEKINVCVDATEGAVRSAAAYKQFSERFFSDLNVVRHSEVCDLILETRKEEQAKGKNFAWIAFRTIAKGIQAIYNATNLNALADSASVIFASYKSLKSSNAPPH